MCTPFCITYCCRLVSQSAKTSCKPMMSILWLIVSTDNNKMINHNSTYFQLQLFYTMALSRDAVVIRLHWHGDKIASPLLSFIMSTFFFFGRNRIYNAHESRYSTNTEQCLAWELHLFCMYQQSEAKEKKNLQRRLLT